MIRMMKRLIALFLLTVMLAAISTALADQTMQQGSMYVNTANGKALRFRSSATTAKDNVLDEIPYGTKVYVISWDGTWARIRYNSAVGYVVKKHLSIGRPEPYEVVQQQREEAAAQKEQEKALRAENAKLDRSRLKKDVYDATVVIGVNELKANVYKKADLTSEILLTYEEGTRLTVTAANTSWAQIKHPGTGATGYMLLEDLIRDEIEEEEILEDD